MTCKQKCAFKLRDVKTYQVEKVCKNMCDLDKPGVDDLVAKIDYDEATSGTSVHVETHLCQIHNNLRLNRDFGYQMNKEEDSESMVDI